MLSKWLLAIFDLVKVLQGKREWNRPLSCLTIPCHKVRCAPRTERRKTHIVCVGGLKEMLKLIQKLVFSEIGADLNNLKAKKVAVLTDAKVQD